MVAIMTTTDFQNNEIETPENELATVEAKITKLKTDIATAEAEIATAKAEVKQSRKSLEAFKSSPSASNERELSMHWTDVKSDQEMVEIAHKQLAYLVTEMTSLTNKKATLTSITSLLIENTKTTQFVFDAALSIANSKAIFPFQIQRPSTKTQKDRPAIFRWKVAGYYKRKTISPGRYRCQLSDEVGGGRAVTAHRLLDHSTYDKHLKEQFDIDDINSFRNTLLLAKGIKKAYKKGRACFVAGDDDKTFHLQIWDDKLKNEPIFKGSNKTIGDCDGKKLSLPPRVEPPYKQVLSYHAQASYKHALCMEWISSNDKVPNIFYASPLKDNMLFISSSQKSTTSEITTNSAN